MDKDLLNTLMESATESLRRDLKHIFVLVARGKLDPGPARDLVAYIKALKELESQPDEEAEKLNKMSKEELEAEAKKLISQK
jgi:hypothetical protein